MANAVHYKKNIQPSDYLLIAVLWKNILQSTAMQFWQSKHEVWTFQAALCLSFECQMLGKGHHKVNAFNIHLS